MTASIDWGHPGFVFVNIVEAFAVDPTGTADAGAQITAALTAMAATGTSGQQAQLQAGTYLLTTAVVVPPGMLLTFAPGVSFTGANAASLSAMAAPEVVKQAGTLAAPADTRVWAAQPSDPNKAPFSAYLHDGLFVATHDSVFFWGYNADNSVNTEPIVRWSMEQDYDDGSGAHKCEVYLETYTAGQANQCRPFFAQLNRTTGDVYELIQYRGTTGFASIGDQNGTLAAKFETAGCFIGAPMYGGGGLTDPTPFGFGVRGVPATGAPFLFGPTPAASSVNVSGGPGTLTPSSLQLAYPYMIVIGTPTNAAANKLLLPSVVGAAYIIDATAVVFNGGATLTPTIAAGDWGTSISAANQTSLFLLLVGNDGKLHGCALTH